VALYSADLDKISFMCMQFTPVQLQKLHLMWGVIPAQAGICVSLLRSYILLSHSWIPACAGMTVVTR
jgi:hypothetical protein